MPISLFSVPSDITVRILPTTLPSAAVARLKRLSAGQCHNLVFTGVRLGNDSNGTWSLSEFCSVLDAASHLCSEISTLDFSSMGMDALFLSFAIDIVKRCPKLKRIEIEDNFFINSASPAGVDPITSALINSYPQIAPPTSAATALGEALADKKYLAYINLTRCRLSDSEGISFVKALLKGDANLGGGSMRNISLHLPHNGLTTSFAKDLTALLNAPKEHCVASISLYGNFISNEDSHVVHAACQKRRLMVEELARKFGNVNGKVKYGNDGANGASYPSSNQRVRTSLGFLVECCGDDYLAFPNVTAMARMLVEEEGLR